MSQRPKFVPSGSGPRSAQGRRALWDTLEPYLADTCQSLELGDFSKARRVEHGSHHLVWRVQTSDGVYALRPCARTRREPAARHASRERLWTAVGTSGVAPRYRGSRQIHTAAFDGWIEAFEWIDGRRLSPAADHQAVARTLARLHERSLNKASDAVPAVRMLPFLQRELRRYLRRNGGSGTIPSLLKTRTRTALATLKAMAPSSVKPCLVHNDLVDGNVLSQRGRVWLIDWDWAMRSSPIVDLFCFLSPFVRSWRAQPRFLTANTATRFLIGYAANRGKGGTAKILRSDDGLWEPYNTLLANWLYHDASHVPHRASLAFYKRAFVEVERLREVIVAFK